MGWQNVADSIFHDVITAGLIAASIFVKNPASQQHAAQIIQAVNPLIQMIDAQLQQQQAATTPAPSPVSVTSTPVPVSAGV